jgi:serine/threonine protein kinase/tetratricopeptide (TPR) repeat protein
LEDLSGRTFRGYEIIEQVGAGGFGVVYRAHQPSVKREVAVKVILPEYADHPDFIKRFETEAQLVARLEHPFIIPLYEYWRDEGGAFLVMRWLKGGSLRDRVEDGPLDLPQLLQVLEQIGGALVFSHEHGVIHRDLKPENILLDEAENTYLTDFGIAKDLEGPRVTEVGKIIGSVDYLSPEQAKGETITPQTDIYALGLVLYELLTCQHPFPNQTPIQMIQKQLNEPLPLTTEKREDLPVWVDEIIQRATAKAPEDRYPNVEALLADFRLAVTAPEKRVVIPEPPAFLSADASVVEKPEEVFVGRESEIKWLDNFLQEAMSGEAHITFISGEPGQGKTVLSKHFATQAMDVHPKLLVASGSCNAFAGIGDPYHPFRELFGMLSADVEAKWAVGEISREHALRLWEALPSTVESFLSQGQDLLNVLVDTPRLLSHAAAIESVPEDDLGKLSKLAETSTNGGREFQQSQLFGQCESVLSYLSQKHPILLVIEDLQWADSASISLLFHLGRQLTGNSVLMIGTYRPSEVALGRKGERHPLGQVLSEVRSQFGNVTLELDEVPQANGRQFVDAYLESEPNQFQESFRKSLFELTAGHPLFVAETLRAMQDRGEIVRNDDSEWEEGESLDWARLPARVEGVIADRIDRIGDDLRETLDVACVEGETFTAEVVAHILELKERGLIHQLSSELEKVHRIVREMGGNSVGSQRLSKYLFRHNLYQKYLYEDLGQSQRVYLHKAVGEILEELYGDRRNEIAHQLAQHFEKAGVRDKAFDYMRWAGEASYNLGALDDATEILEEALELLEGDPQSADQLALQIQLGGIYGFRGNYDQAQVHLESALGIARDLGDRAAEAEVLASLGRNEGPWRGNRKVGRRYLDEAMAIARELEDKRLLLFILRQKGNMASFPGESSAEAVTDLQESLSLAREVGEQVDVANALNSLGNVARNEKEFEEAIEFYQASLAEALISEDQAVIVMIQNNLAQAMVYLGQYEQARRLVEDGLAATRRTGSSYLIVSALYVLGVTQAEVGEFELAQQYLTEELQIAMSFGQDSEAVLDALIGFAWLRAREDDLDIALQWLGLVSAQASISKFAMTSVEVTIEVIRGEMPDDEVERHLKLGESLELDAVVEQLLSDGAGE